MSKNVADILRERAEELAKESACVGEEEDFLEILVFKLSSELYGIETRYIQEVCPLKEHAVIPGAPPFLLGLMNVRARVMPIIDLKVLFELPQTECLNRKAVILEGEEKEFAIVVDDFVGINKVLESAMDVSLPTLTEIREEFLKGVTLDKIIVLDGKKLLLSNQIVVDESV